MITITAILTARAGAEAALETALLEVAGHVAAHEPGTVGFFVARSLADPRVLTTYERFVDEAAMAAHNGSAAVAAFFAAAGPLLEGPVTLVTAREISTRPASTDHGGTAP
jgi:quinol monooxygenase YgiN